MRIPLTLAAALLSGTAAWAEDFVLRADITAATVFARGAEMTRTLRVALPPGAHRLILPIRDARSIDDLRVSASGGLRIGLPERIEAWPLAEGALDSPVEAAARAARDAAEDAVQEAEDALALREAEVAGLRAQLAYLGALAEGGGNGAGVPSDPADLAAALSALGGETARVGAALQAAEAGLRPLQEAVEEARADRDAAQRALDYLRPFGKTTAALGIDVIAGGEGETEAVFEITYFADTARWEPRYRLDLESDSGRMSVTRYLHLDYAGAAPLRDVTMRFTTSDPRRRRAPTEATPTPARIRPETPPEPAPLARGGLPSLEAAPALRAADIVAEPVVLQASVDGLTLSYSMPAPVSVGPSGSVTLPFDSLDFEMETENRAVPRRDATAFLVATGRNDSGEPILPGEARFFRDGAYIGAETLPTLPAGGEMELAFGPLDHLQLDWQDLSLQEGDRGIFVTSNEMARQLRFGVENTSERPETVRLIYATPFSEQEDLTLDVTLSPAPTARDIDDLRGVHAWEFTLAPGERREVEMGVSARWPEDQIMLWRP
jgi:uncharacterized protein (TIGR02231 family)